MQIAVIIPAAGSASRYTAAGGLRHKIDEDLGGKVVLQRAVELFTKYDDDDVVLSPIIVAGPAGDAEFQEFKSRHADRLAILGALICRGGPTRAASVRAALALVPAEATHVAVHDAARPAASFELLGRVFRAARDEAGVIPAIEVHDTLKRVSVMADAPEDADPLAAILGDAPRQARRYVDATVDRAAVHAVQTPQVFRADLLRAAHEHHASRSGGGVLSTDDAGLVEAYWASRGETGHRVRVVEGDVRNVKITTPTDVALVRAVMGFRPPEDKPAHRRF